MTVAPIQQAMQRARVRDAARRSRTRIGGVAEATIRVAYQAVNVRKSGDMLINRAPDADPDDALLLVYDASLDAYRPVRLPPGTRWTLAEKNAGPKLYLPLGARR